MPEYFTHQRGSMGLNGLKANWSGIWFHCKHFVLEGFHWVHKSSELECEGWFEQSGIVAIPWIKASDNFGASCEWHLEENKGEWGCTKLN